MLDHQYRGGTRTFPRYAPISAVLRIAPEGLVLGAGTVLLPADAPRQLRSPKGYEGRLLTLLSAAYGRAIELAVLGNIERAARAWNQGDDSLAYIHIAHARLQQLHDFRAGSYRLFMADCAMKHGASHRAVLEALHLDARYIDAVEKLYNPNQPRVPAGSGRISGQWTRLLSWLGELSAAQATELGAYALRILGIGGGAAAVFGLLFIPSPNNIHVEGEVRGIPGLRYSWNRDEALLHFTYDAGDGEQRTFAAYVDGDTFRDEQGRVIGRLLPDGGILIDSAVASPDLLKDDEPRLCPIPGPISKISSA